MQITKNTDGSIFLHQTAYPMKLMDRFRMQEANPVSTPADDSDI